jgi:hypothetical protein
VSLIDLKSSMRDPGEQPHRPARFHIDDRAVGRLFVALGIEIVDQHVTLLHAARGDRGDDDCVGVLVPVCRDRRSDRGAVMQAGQKRSPVAACAGREHNDQPRCNQSRKGNAPRKFAVVIDSP